MNYWIYYALLSAAAAGATAILAKLGVQGVPSNLATAVRTLVVSVRIGCVSSALAYASPRLHFCPLQWIPSAVFVQVIRQPFGQTMQTISRVCFSGG